METIVLNKKKKKIKWKNIFIMLLICAATAVCVFLIGHFRIQYSYYQIDPQLNRHELGISAHNNLINTVTIDTLEDIKKQGYQISDFRVVNVIDKQYIFTWDNNKDDTEQITSAIVNSIDVDVYALILPIKDKEYYLPPTKGYDILHQLQELDNSFKDIHLLNGKYINIKNVSSNAEIEELINGYKK